MKRFIHRHLNVRPFLEVHIVVMFLGTKHVFPVASLHGMKETLIWKAFLSFQVFSMWNEGSGEGDLENSTFTRSYCSLPKMFSL